MAELSFVTSPNERSFIATGPFPTGTAFHMSWTGATKDRVCGQYVYACQFNTDGHGVRYQTFSSLTVGGSFDYVLGSPAAEVEFDAFSDTYCSDGTLHGFDFSSTFTGTYCQYGTELSPTGTANILATSALLTSLATPFGWQWMVPFLGTVIGSWFNVAQLCSTPPPSPPPAGWDPRYATSSELSNAALFILWYSNCQCIPGTPTPTPYPPPVLTPPSGLSGPPAIACSNADVCALLVDMAQLLRNMNATLGAQHELVTLLQRYGLPFATISGARHSGLTGGGAFAVSRLIGVRIEITNLDQQHRVLEGTPPYTWDLGWISMGTPDGLLQEKRVTSMNQLWLPANFQDATTFGYFFKTGVTAAVTELQAEP